MSSSASFPPTVPPCGRLFVFLLSVLTVAINATLAAAAQSDAPQKVAIAITPQLPADIPGGAPDATLTQAAVFAWQEFIALNWPAVPQTGQPNTRELADNTKSFGDPGYNNASKPLVWHTFRGKVEIFPGFGLPAGSQVVAPPGTALKNLAAGGQPAYYGYDAAPVYTYSPTAIPPASGTPSAVTPWINLDENSQIGLDLIYAGAGSGAPGASGNQILFAAKGSRIEFDYLAPLGWWAGGAPFADTKRYVQQNLASPPPGDTQLVSFPNGTIELKTAWRRLAPHEDASRFYTTTVRYYVQGPGGATQYVDDTFALLALHIIQKTPTAPYFIFATFEQADNITDARGRPVEDGDGAPVGGPAATAFTPEVVSHNATAQAYQTFSPTQSSVQNPLGQLYYQNEPGNGLPDGTILVNRRKHAIPDEIVAVNRSAHEAIAAYVQAVRPGTQTPWLHYKLINVQAVPLGGKPPGVDYTGPQAATYYQANSVVETDYNLQVFSGKFYGGPLENSVGNTITDFAVDGTPFANVAHAGAGYNMGGCMGCHGNAQQGGGDFSFILLGGRVTSGPDTVQPASGLVGAASVSVGAKAPGAADVAPVRPRHVQRYQLRP